LTTLNQLHAQKGDKKLDFDTSSSAGRKSLLAVLTEKAQQRMAIFVNLQGQDYKYVSYNPRTDSLVVENGTNRKGRKQTLKIPAANAQVFLVPPLAGG
jgi:hypothetical protein